MQKCLVRLIEVLIFSNMILLIALDVDIQVRCQKVLEAGGRGGAGGGGGWYDYKQHSHQHLLLHRSHFFLLMKGLL